ncbi:MAG: UvrD-helicase domain-containing protein, partial [Gordonibacter sp.]|uniref:UvrD-helicase domain-containing protein n=1 Tax=Gordonibacter sp. TaxID=1968902 RepID=UPI002FC6E754
MQLYTTIETTWFGIQVDGMPPQIPKTQKGFQMELSSFLIFILIAVLGIVCLVTAILLSRSGKAGAGKYKDKLDYLLTKIRNLHERKTRLLDFDSGYLMKRDWDAIASETEELQAEVLRVPFWFRMSHQYSKTLKSFLDAHVIDLTRKNRNSAYVQCEAKICDSLLSSVDGKSLDDQQRLAIFTDEYSNLIIAGAGSGKTLTVVGKIKYLVDRRGIDPERILVTSFTRKSVHELTERIERAGIKNVSCKTFHSIGFKQLDDVVLTNDKTLENCIKEYLKRCVVKESKQIQSFLEFYGCFAHLPKDYAEYAADGQRMEALKAVDLKTIKGKLAEVAVSKLKRLDTLHGERVRSLEELT